MIASTCAAFSSTRTARVGAWSGIRCAPCGVEHLLDEPARIGDLAARRACAQRAERIGRRAHRVAQRVLGVAEIDVLGHRSRGQRVHRPRQRAQLGFEVEVEVARRRIVVRVLEVGHQPDRGVRRAATMIASPAVEGVAAGTGCPRAGRGHRRVPAAPRAIAGCADRRARPRCAASAAATPHPRRRDPARAGRCGRRRRRRRRSPNVLAPTGIAHPGRRRARLRRPARRWPTPTARHSGTT